MPYIQAALCNMHIFLLLFMVLLSEVNASSISHELLYAKRMGGVYEDQANSVAVDSEGNIYAAGFFSGTVDFDPGLGVFNLTESGGRDIFISKLTSTGDFIWAKRIGGAGTDEARSIVVNDNGDVFVTGFFGGNIDFDPGSAVYDISSRGGFDVFVVKLNGAGDFIWAKSIGGTNYEMGMGIAFDGSGNLLVVGNFYGTMDADPSGNTFNLISNGDADVFICKIDSIGNFLWAKGFGSPQFDDGKGVAVDQHGAAYITGVFRNVLDFNPASEQYNIAAIGSDDAFLSKFDGNGGFLWAKSIGGAGDERGLSVAVDDIGNVYSTGFFSMSANFDPSQQNSYILSGQSKEVYVSKHNSLGVIIWAKSMGGGGQDEGRSIAVDGDRNVYTTGNFELSGDFDPNFGQENLMSMGLADVFVSELDENGNYIWSKSVGSGGGNDYGRSIVVDDNGYVYFSGGFEGAADFDHGAGISNLISLGAADIFISRLQPLDIDEDGIFDSFDNCLSDANADQLNTDGDEQGDACDADDDNDGVYDVSDIFPLDASETMDSDNDGTGNNADPDDDNDGTPDVLDAFPLDASESADNDSDGVGNNADALPDNPSETLDTDKDGIGNNADYDDDNDTLADSWELAHGRNPLVPDYDIAAGGNGGCAITDDGLVCWGDNGNGQGNPPPLPDPHDIARGLEHACAVSGNAVVCWGANNVNQTAVPALTNPKGVAAGHNNNCATDDTGVKCWGEGGNGINTPPTTTKPRNVDVGDDHACAVDATGVKCWGNNSSGETTVPALQEPTQVSAGKDFSCARDKNGVKCWGDNTNGKKNAPVMPAPKQVDAGEDHACAVAADGVHCWGNDDMGQTDVPPGLQNPVAVAAGNKFTCALDEKGVHCWGDNSNGKTNVPSLGVDPDGDGVITSLDAFWLDPTESADNDNDGIGNNGDIDDDNDGVSDTLEVGLGTNPNTADNFANAIHLDSDGDGIGNVKETAIGTNPNLADSDGDGISDDLELIQYITNPMSADTDGDAIPDSIDPEPGIGACTMPLNGLYKGSVIGDGVGL
jgi:alpha-tubulin suppressor-like RCC1 family protein